jgi:chemotaxis family two-component system response regulator Rcp1
VAFLQEFRSNLNPVILTTSGEEVEIVKSNQLQANFYINKPVLLDGFLCPGKRINNFWLAKVKVLPQRQTV